SSDKDLAGILHLLAPHFDHAYLTRYTDNPRAVAPEKLAALLSPAALSFSLHASPHDAWQAACADAGAEDLLCVTGSVFLAGEMRPMLTQALPSPERKRR